MHRRKGATPVGLLTSTRCIEAAGPLARNELFEKLVRALAQEFATVQVLADAADGAPQLCCKVPFRWLAPVELRGPVRIHLEGNKAEVMFEARLCAGRRLWLPVTLGLAFWPLWWLVGRTYGAQRTRAFEALEQAMGRFAGHYRAAE